MKKRIPRSLRKYIRREKSRIRREFLDLKEQLKQIKELYSKLIKSNEDKRNTQPGSKKGNRG